jgi:hypothetical protein
MAKKTVLGEKYGSIGLDGKMVNPFVYDEIDPWLFGYAIATKGNDFYMIDTLGKEYPLVGDFERVAMVMDGVAWCRNDNRKYGLINKEGKMLAEMKYEDITWLNYKNSKFQDWAIIEDANGRKGLIDKSGKMIVPLTHNSSFTGSGGKVYVKMGKKTGVLKSDNSIDFSCPFELDRTFSMMGFDRKFEIYKERINNSLKEGIVDTNFNIVIPAKHNNLSLTNDYIVGFYERFPMMGGKSGALNMRGDTILQMVYSNILCRSNNDIVAAKGKREWYWFDLTGRQILSFPVYHIKDRGMTVKYQLEAMPIQKDSSGGYALYNRQGVMVTKDPFENINYTTYPNYFLTKKAEKYGVLSVNGDQLLPCEFDQISWFVSNFDYISSALELDSSLVKGIIATKNGKSIIYDTSGKKKLFEGDGSVGQINSDYLWLRKESGYDVYKINW